MKKIIARILLVVLSLSLCLGLLIGCGQSESKNPGGGGDIVNPDNPDNPDVPTEEKAKNPMKPGEPYGAGRTLNIYLWGSKPQELDKILAEFKKRTKDIFAFDVEFKFDPQGVFKQNLTLQIGSSEALDLVFDAQWIYLEEWSKNGNYVKLDKYFNNDEFPGLKRGFSEGYLNNNRYNGGIYGVPLMESFGVTNAAYYRLDWCKKAAKQNPEKYGDLANGIDDAVEAEKYLYWVRDNTDVTPFLVNKDGFGPATVISGMFDSGDHMTLDQVNQLGVRTNWTIVPGLQVSAYVNPETQSVDGLYFPQYEDPVEVNNFPAGFNSETAFSGNWQGGMERMRQWYEDGIVSHDALNEVDSESKFRAGRGGMVVRSLEQYISMNQALKVNDPSAELEIYIYSKGEREMNQPQFGTDFKAWNYLCIPKTSPDQDLAILFLDWLFASRENHDLFQYGIEGIHWDKHDPENGEGEYLYEKNQNHTLYDISAYELTWNPNYIRLPYGVSDKVAKYLAYCYDPKSYTELLYSDFRFDTTTVSSQLQNPSFGTYMTQRIPFDLGTQENPVAKYTAIINERLNNKKFQNDLQIIKEEFRLQLQEYLDARQ